MKKLFLLMCFPLLVPFILIVKAVKEGQDLTVYDDWNGVNTVVQAVVPVSLPGWISYPVGVLWVTCAVAFFVLSGKKYTREYLSKL